MSQNQKYVAPGGATSNRTVLEAAGAVRKLLAIGIQTFGIVAIAAGGNEIVEQADFEHVGIDPNEPANLFIRCKQGAPASDDQAIPEFGEYRNVDAVLDQIAKLDHDPETAIARFLAEFDPGITPEQVHQRLLQLPGVRAAFSEAVKAGWAMA